MGKTSQGLGLKALDKVLDVCVQSCNELGTVCGCLCTIHPRSVVRVSEPSRGSRADPSLPNTQSH